MKKKLPEDDDRIVLAHALRRALDEGEKLCGDREYCASLWLHTLAGTIAKHEGIPYVMDLVGRSIGIKRKKYTKRKVKEVSP